MKITKRLKNKKVDRKTNKPNKDLILIRNLMKERDTELEKKSIEELEEVLLNCFSVLKKNFHTIENDIKKRREARLQ